MFRDILPGAVARQAPQVRYISASPHDPEDPTRWPGDGAGDNHYWDAWFWGVTFQAQRTSRHRFVSEFGFQSLPDPEVLRSLGAELDSPATTETNRAILAHHQRCHGGDDLLRRYVERECLSIGPTLRALCARSQFVQALALKTAMEHWRASFGRTRGALIWQLNDIWPAVSWSLVDAAGNRKLAWEWVARAFAPLLIAGFEDRSARCARLVAVNDMTEPCACQVRWTIRSVAGNSIESRLIPNVVLPPDGGCCDLGTVELIFAASRNGGESQVYLHFELIRDGKTVSEDCAVLVAPGEFVKALPPGARDLLVPCLRDWVVTLDTV